MASKAEMAPILSKLLTGMPVRGVKAKDAFDVYADAIGEFTVEEIEHGVHKFLSGQCPNINPEYVPKPPQLAKIIREAAGLHKAVVNADSPSVNGTLHAYLRPNSKLIARNLTKNQVVEGRGGGIYPAGCIWCPNPLGEDQTWGDLYAPDPAWRGSWPVGQQRPQGPAPGEPERYLARTQLQKLRDFSEPAQTYEPEMELIPPPTIRDYSKEPLEPPTEHLLRNLEDHAKMDAIEAEREAQYEKGVEG